jgi:uncharacterized protein YgiB involved in biofilm formation
MNTTHALHRPGRPARQRRRAARLLLAVVGAAAVLLASGCDTAQQVPWASYDSSLQPRIDAAADTGQCAALQAFRTAAENTSRAHEKATGFPNDALVSYIEAAQHRAGCPAGNGST